MACHTFWLVSINKYMQTFFWKPGPLSDEFSLWMYVQFRFFRHLLVLFLMHSTSLSLFRCVVSYCQTAPVSSVGSTLSLIFFLLCGGFVIPPSKLPCFHKKSHNYAMCSKCSLIEIFNFGFLWKVFGCELTKEQIVEFIRNQSILCIYLRK